MIGARDMKSAILGQYAEYVRKKHPEAPVPGFYLAEGLFKDAHLGLLGLLNSSVTCFWLKQVCHNKGEGGGTRVEAGNSALGDEAWKSHFAFNSTKVAEFPLVDNRPQPEPADG